MPTRHCGDLEEWLEKMLELAEMAKLISLLKRENNIFIDARKQNTF